MSRNSFVRAITASTCLLLSGCADSMHTDVGSALSTLPNPDGRMFVKDVYPILLRDCAFSACHGSENRFLRVVGPGRPRLDPNAVEVTDPLQFDELLFSYDRARSLLASTPTGAVTESLLLTKPLEFSAGGQGHRGADDYGRNVYTSTADPSLAVLMRWAATVGGPPTEGDVDAAIERAANSEDEFDHHFSSEAADQS